MLAEILGNSLGTGTRWTTICDKNAKGASVFQQSGELKRKVSSQKSCFLGVETWAELTWEDWDLGGEFTKTLLLKNVHRKLQKLRFRPPVSKFFTTLFPQIIVLSPGTSFSLPVTFHPLERCEYQDSIEFQAKEGFFQVCLHATLPRHSLEIPESILLPTCAVRHSCQSTFLFRNASKLQTGFQWEVDSPFKLSPDRGVLGPGQECLVTVAFQPQEALVYQREARCVFGDEGGSSCTLLLQGLSKYPFLEFSAAGQEEGCKVLDFGSVAVEASVEKHFEIINKSPVSASFSLSRLRRPPLSKSVFQCGVEKGEVAAQSAIRVPVSFSPVSHLVDSSSVDYLSLTCPGALNKTLLKLTGTCIGPHVSLSSSLLDFGCVKEGEESLRSVTLVNTSPVEAHYQFDLDGAGHSVFSLQPAGGTLPPHRRVILKLLFHPHHPIAYHRRVACLLLHREPLFLDIIGTCHSEQLKPAILRPRHLELYQQHLARGLTQYPPDMLSAMLAEGKILVDQQGALILQDPAGDPAGAETTSGAVPASALAERGPMEEYYQSCAGGKGHEGGSGEGPGSHVTLEPSELVFHPGYTSLPVSITNHTKGRLSLVWTHAADSPFSVTPASCDLQPLKSTSFRVTYKPQQLNTLHGAQLECFALYKVLRDHRQVEDRTLCPSWCLTVRAIGHSFQAGREHFNPQLSLKHPQVVFPALSVELYRTVLLQNTGDLPLTFSLDPEQSPSVCVFPTCGLVPPGQHHILTLRTTPSEDNLPELPLTLQLNADPKHTQELSVVSLVEKLRVCLEGDGSLFFKPTAVGACSQRCYRIRNFSRLPLQFQWKVSGPDRGVISVEPDSGELQPNESSVQMWSFTPMEEMVYNLKTYLTFWPSPIPDSRKSRLPFKIFGMASKGSIQPGSPVLELGEVLVGGCRSFEVPLVNNGPCSVSFSLSVKQNLLDPGLTDNTPTEHHALELDSGKGVIAARSRLLVRATVRPARRAQYSWSISYQILSSQDCAVTEPRAVCEVRGEGVFPALQVSDVRSCGSAEGLSKLQLWSLFSLDALNTHLGRDPTPPELTYRVPTRHSLRRCPSIFTSAMLDFNFSAAPQGSEPSCVLLMFDNAGSIPVDWSFLFPEDQQIELEYWAETGEFSSTELHQMKVQDNRLFSISPRTGTLLPGQQRAVQFNYRHDFAGTYRLPVLFKLSHGREILLNFMGVTVERDRHYLHFTSSKHLFSPVAIGGFNPPIQVYELYNGGALSVSYQLDTEALEQLTTDNFGHPVLQCLNPQGEVRPGKTALLEWVFSPLEAKTYSVDTSIHVLNGDTMLMTFEGCGFDKQLLGDSAPPQLHDAYLSVPSIQRVPLPGQVVFLSEERVSLGDIPVCSSSTRILFLSNVSRTDSVHYNWNLADQQAVHMHPECGFLSPEESVLCTLTLKTSGSPRFYQLDLICEVTLEEALVRYRRSLQEWEEETERQKNEFTLTERDLQKADPALSHTHKLQERNAQGSEPPPRGSGPTVRRYKTLPPIRSSSSSAIVGGTCARPTRAERRAQREAATVWRRPEPPHPALLHLGVTARSHALLEFQTFFPSLLSTHYVYRSSQPTTRCSVLGPCSPPSTDLPPLSHGPERQVLTHTLTSILRSLLDDPFFHQSLVSGVSESVPYFNQLRESPKPTTSPPPSPTQDPAAAGTAVPLPPSGPPPPQPLLGGSLGGAGRAEQLQAPISRPPHQEPPYHHQDDVQEAIRRFPEFNDLAEEVLLNTLQNLMTEAFLGELVLTARPRLIALPPFSARKNSCGFRRFVRGQADSDRSREPRNPQVLSPGPTCSHLPF